MKIKQDKKVASDLSLKSFFKNFTNEVFHVDGRIVTTLSALIFKPGLLTKEHFANANGKYIQPLKIYFAINFIFFLLTPALNTAEFRVFSFNLESLTRHNPTLQTLVNDEIAEAVLTEEIYRERFDAHIKYSQPAFIFIIIPCFALLLGLVHFRKGRYFVEHLYFSIHFLAFFLLSLFSLSIFFRFVEFGLSLFSVSTSIVGALFLITFAGLPLFYLTAAIKNFYNGKWFGSFLRSIVLIIGLFVSMSGYIMMLFFYTVIALRLS